MKKKRVCHVPATLPTHCGESEFGIMHRVMLCACVVGYEVGAGTGDLSLMILTLSFRRDED